MVLILLISLGVFPLFSQDEKESEYSLILSSGIDIAQYTLSGDAAWDKFQLNSVQALITFKIPIEDSNGQYAVMVAGYKKPIFASIAQLDGATYNISVDSASQFFGIYTYTGFLIPREFYIWDLYFSAGPAFDLYIGNGRYLASLSLEGKLDVVIPMGKRINTGLGANIGYDFWGIHNMGQADRYNGSIQSGLGCQLNVFMAVNL